jgi:hypothetical protein
VLFSAVMRWGVLQKAPFPAVMAGCGGAWPLSWQMRNSDSAYPHREIDGIFAKFPLVSISIFSHTK